MRIEYSQENRQNIIDEMRANGMTLIHDEMLFEGNFLTFQPPTDTEILGMQMVEKDLQVMELQNANDFMGMQLVEKDMEIFNLQNENETLGAQIVDIDIRLMMRGL